MGGSSRNKQIAGHKTTEWNYRSHNPRLIARTEPSARIEKVVAVCALPIHRTPRITSRMPNTKNQPQDFLTCSRPATKKSETAVIVFLLLDTAVRQHGRIGSQRKNTSGAFFGTENGVADFGSELNFPNTDGLFWKCCSNASTRFWSLG